MLNKIKGARKIVFVLIALIIATVGLFLGKIDAVTFADLLKWLGGFFIAGNVIEHVAGAATGP